METPEEIELQSETGNSSGLNRTGIMLNPALSAELIDGIQEALPNPDGDGADLAASRADYVQDSLTIGSLPTILADETDTDTQTLGEGELSLLLDKLGERLAFERQGTRLYETFSLTG